eukprot:312596-Prymnesium_polylepis.2
MRTFARPGGWRPGATVSLQLVVAAAGVSNSSEAGTRLLGCLLRVGFSPRGLQAGSSKADEADESSSV